MLTRFKVSGFKNLVDVDVRFGPFTCIAGVNGVGKSNLFDAIHFLSSLADNPLVEAAKSVRDDRGRTTDVRSLFHRSGEEYDEQMSFEAEMIVPSEGADDLGQAAKATSTFLRYSLLLRYRKEESAGSPGPLELLREELVPIRQGDTTKSLLFPHGGSAWRNSALIWGRRTVPYISTDSQGPKHVIRLHRDKQDNEVGDNARQRLASSMPRTVLSSVTEAESATVLLARREMASWRQLQLEPSSLRKPDDFDAPSRLDMDGSHLAATLYRLSRKKATRSDASSSEEASENIYAEVANRLAGLIEDVRDIRVDRDVTRGLLTIRVTDMDGTGHPARALSDGTLRFLALAVIELDPEAKGLLCLEEPENGIHPDRIPAMLELLQDIATDPYQAVGPDNPLRQVIINTHSPLVLGQVPDDSALFAQLREIISDGKRFKGARFSCLPNTWRAEKVVPPEKADVVSLGDVVRFLNPISPAEPPLAPIGAAQGRKLSGHQTRRGRRVVDRSDTEPWLIPDAAKKP